MMKNNKEKIILPKLKFCFCYDSDENVVIEKSNKNGINYNDLPNIISISKYDVLGDEINIYRFQYSRKTGKPYKISYRTQNGYVVFEKGSFCPLSISAKNIDYVEDVLFEIVEKYKKDKNPLWGALELFTLNFSYMLYEYKNK